MIGLPFPLLIALYLLVCLCQLLGLGELEKVFYCFNVVVFQFSAGLVRYFEYALVYVPPRCHRLLSFSAIFSFLLIVFIT